MAARNEDQMIIMFPFMAQGHITPFLALALQIEQRFGYKIIFINTPLNLKKLHSSLPPNSSISLTELPFCSTDHDLPPDSENTDSLPYPLIVKLFQASLTLKPSFNELIMDLTQKHGCPPLCIIGDMFLGWTLEIAKELKVFHATFNTCSAYGAGVYYSMWLNLPHCKTECDEFPLRDFPEVNKIHITQLPNILKVADGNDPWAKFFHKVLPLWFDSDAILLNTVEELDYTGLKYFRRKFHGRPVWPIIPTFKHTIDEGVVCSIRPQKKSGIDLEKCIEWLNRRSPNSVLFVSFGSQNSISRTQLMNLAIGLEESGKNFIWVVRPPIEFDINGEFRSEWLPDGYESRLSDQNRGLIIHKWAPQLEILAHKSTCAFLSHCGWNSVMESLSHGVPLLGWPLSGEQTYNSKFLEEEVGVCIEVGRGTSCEIVPRKLMSSIELVMGEGEKGVEMRKKAMEIRDMIEDAVREDDGFKGGSLKAMDELVHAALAMRERKREINGTVENIGKSL
ncbi:hypothetical protein ACHQM5_018883 [Ranunculus cassubicifolius]